MPDENQLDRLGSMKNGSVPLRPLREHVADSLAHYLGQLNGSAPCDLYQMVIDQVEAPLLQAVLDYSDGNQSRAAAILGLNRGTLRKKLKAHGLHE